MLTPLTKYENVLTAVFIAVMMRTHLGLRPLKFKRGEGSITRQRDNTSNVFNFSWVWSLEANFWFFASLSFR